MLPDWDLKSCGHAPSMGGEAVLGLASLCHGNVAKPKVTQQNTCLTKITTPRASLCETTQQ